MIQLMTLLEGLSLEKNVKPGHEAIDMNLYVYMTTKKFIYLSSHTYLLLTSTSSERACSRQSPSISVQIDLLLELG